MAGVGLGVSVYVGLFFLRTKQNKTIHYTTNIENVSKLIKDLTTQPIQLHLK